MYGGAVHLARWEEAGLGGMIPGGARDSRGSGRGVDSRRSSAKVVQERSDLHEIRRGRVTGMRETERETGK